MSNQPKNPIFLAIDNIGLEETKLVINKLSSSLGGVKFGLEFWNNFGKEAIQNILNEFKIPLFLDLKLHDIPNTVYKGLKYALTTNPFLTTIHAAGGVEMVRKSKEACEENFAKTNNKTNLLAVTVLTSLSEQDLIDMGITINLESYVLKLAENALKSGADGVVCSPMEIDLIKKNFPDSLIVTPGIRMAEDGTNDQKRILTPKEALAKGANYLVIGRPILQSENPALSLENILNSI